MSDPARHGAAREGRTSAGRSPGSSIQRRLAWTIGARVIIATALLGSAVLLQIHAPGTLPADPFFLLIALTFALTIVYAATRTYAERHRWLIAVQLVLDTGMVSAFVFATGGLASYFALLYVLPIIAGSILLSRRGGVWLALVSTLLYATLVGSQYLAQAGQLDRAWLGPSPIALPSMKIAAYTIVTNLVAFVAVALLSGSLSDGLRRADRRLEQASIAIADLKALNQHILESLQSGLATTDPKGRLLTFNRAAEAITGHAASTVVGRPAAEVLQLPAEYAALLARDLDGLSSPRCDYTYRTSEGTAKEIGIGTTYLLTPGGRAGYLLTFQDVTDLRRLERDGRRRQRLAAVGEMAAGIAHEIRNPLASVRGSIQILRQELALSDEQAQLMDIVLRESDRLNETIGSFLSYARPQNRGAARVDVGRMLRDTAVLLGNSAEVHERHTIEVRTTPGDLAFDADENQMRQIVWNLATNGLRAMREGGRLLLEATLAGSSGEHADGEVIIRVKDEGVGIPAEELDRIFQPFHGGFAQGSGLGLAIVHRIVTDHDGEIEIESAPGQGTAVSVRLPVRVAVGTLTAGGSSDGGSGQRTDCQPTAGSQTAAATRLRQP